MRISLLSAHNTYVVAEGGGGGDINANRPVAASWETFDLCDVFGVSFGTRQIASGAMVTFRTKTNEFLVPDWRNGVVRTGNIIEAGVRIVKVGGSTGQNITDKDTVAFSSKTRLPTRNFGEREFKWITAEDADPRRLVANRQMALPHSWEKFKLYLTPGIADIRVGDSQNLRTIVIPSTGPTLIPAAIILDRSALPGGYTVTLSSSRPAQLNVDSRVMVRAGATEQRFDFKPLIRPTACRGDIPTIDVVATPVADPYNSRTATFTLTPDHEMLSINTHDSFHDGEAGDISVQIRSSAPLPAGTYQIKLSGSTLNVRPNVQQVNFTPASASIPAVFQVTPTTSSPYQGVCVTATATGEGRTIDDHFLLVVGNR